MNKNRKYCETAQKPINHKKEALSKASYSRKLSGVDIRVYKCPFCHGWHLTSKV